MNHRLVKYSGSKFRFLDKIIPIINETDNKIFVEPFVGSGSVMLNIDYEKFDKIYINDADRHVICIFNAFKNGTYQKYLDFLNFKEKNFGTLKNKESYYKFRNLFNEKVLNSGTYAEGFFLRELYGACINHFARFGPNGFNQAFGNRQCEEVTEEMFYQIQEKLKKVILNNLDFFEFVEKFPEDLNKCCFFLDPPYLERPSSYSKFSSNYFTKFIKWMNNQQKCHIIYTDIEMEEIDLIYDDKIILRDNIANTGPSSRKKDFNKREVMYIKKG